MKVSPEQKKFRQIISGALAGLEPRRVKHLIIGGGLSGLTTAYFLKKDYLILEQEAELGGYCRTIHHPKYVWDYAGHFYHFQTEEFKDLFLSLVEPSEIIRQVKNTKIYYQNKLIDYPFQQNIHQLAKGELIDCLYDRYFKIEKEEYDSFLDMLYGKFGRSIVTKFLKPYNEKLYATNLDTLDKDAMGRFFPYADLSDIVANFKQQSTKTYNDSFLYLKRGTGYFIDKLAATLEQKSIRLGETVTQIDLVGKSVITAGGEKIYYENLINTAPLNRALALLDPANPLLAQLSCNKVLVFNIGFDRPSPQYQTEHWVYFPDKALNFYRIGFYNNLLQTENLSVYVEIGFPSSQVGIDVEAEYQKVLAGMRQVGIISRDMQPVDRSVIMMDPAYVHISGATNGQVEQTLAELAQQDVYCLGRYGRWTYNSMEDCMVWARDLAQKLTTM